MITITDLPVSRALDMQAMSSLRGGGAPWVFGSFRPYTTPTPSAMPVVNFYEITNNYTFIDQMVNQFTVLDINNSGDNSNVTAVLLGSHAVS
ncbi:MAG: hypothetical protein U1E89_03910 [Burkholderiaceae bacterium]